MPETTLRSKRAVALAVAATLVGVSATVLLSGQSTTAHAAAAPGSTVRASVANGSNAQAPDGGAESELSADGTAVVFTSTSQLDNLDTGETRNVYVRDLRNNRTVMISRGQFTRPTPPPPSSSSTPPPPTTTTTTTECCVIGLAGDRLLALNGMRAQPPLEFGERPPTGSSSQPTISGDGRYVAFMTSADNILPEDDDTDQDLLVCDRDPDGDGVFDEQRPNNGGLDYTYFRVNQPEVLHGDGYSYRVDFPNNPKISDDASRIVWEDTLDAGDGYYKDVVRTAVLRSPGGAVGKPGTVEVVNSTLGDLVPDDQYSPDVSADGQFVVLVGNYVAAVDNGDGFDYIPFHAVVRTDMVNGKVLRVDWDVNTTPDDITFLSTDESVNLSVPSISSDGAEIAFEAEEFQDNCSEGCWHSVADQPMVFVVRIAPDERPVDSIVASRDNGGEIINGIRPALSGDGRFIAFGTDNLNAHDGVDRQVGSEFSSCVNFQPSEGLRGDPKINLSGLPPTSDTRNQRTFCQVVVRDLVVDRQRLQNEDTRLPGTLASPGTGTDCAETVPEGGTCAGNGDSPAFNGSAPSLSHNGSTIAYDSDASNLVPDEVDDNKRTDVYVRTFRPDLRPDPTPLDFGDVQLGDTFDQVVRFDHIGLGPLVVTDAVIEDSDEFAVGAQTCVGEAVVLQQTDNCEVSVTFAPTTEGDRAGTLRLTLRDGREFTVPLLGNGTVEVVPPDGPRFAAAPDPLNFGDRLLLSEGPTQTVTVTNVGDTPLTVKSISVVSAVAAADYTFAADTCTNVPVAANGTCQVTVRFSPVAALDRPAVLRFVDDAPGNQAHLIGLSGKGSTPTIQLSPGVAQPGRVVTVTGAGFAPKVPVTITLADSVETAVAVPNETGVFSVNMLILPKTPIGGRLVTATIDTTNPAIAAKASLLIVTPTVSPSTFVIRG